MNLIFDGIVLAAALLSIILGAKRGFIKSVMGVCTLIAALFVAYAFTPPLSAYIESRPFIRSISSSITDTIKSLSANDRGTYDLDRLFADMPDAFRQIVDRYKADPEELMESVSPAADSAAGTVDTLSDLIAEPVAGAISGALAFLGLFVATVIALKILTWLLDLIFQLPVLKSANSMLGFLFGVVAALVWAWVLSSLSVTLIGAMSSISPDLFSETIVDNTVIIKFFSSLNLNELLDYVIR